MFNNPADPLNTFLDIQAGAGGTEACDWASMLLRQYLKYAERKGFKATLEDPKVLASFEKYDQSVIYMNTEDYTKYARETFPKEKKLIEQLGLAKPA